ncbi:type II CRISPR-associated endonuclease Cas1 [Gammaproteobacteria bacterium]|nr:type II CRISPR-associated endonuclease Cas1 [Gammaproteobacteria bacterium]
MLKRVIDVSSRSYIHIRNQQLIINQNNEDVGSIPVEDLGVLILQHPAITLSIAVVTSCQKNNVVVVFCDEHHLPSSTLLPLTTGHSLHSKILACQINLKLPLRKRLWKEIVSMKLQEQHNTLLQYGKSSERILKLSREVKSGDPENSEAQAAKIYWKILLGKGFKRDTEEPGANTLLNYGYTIIRALFARAIVSSGLHPTLGLHHRNQYNALCLADDLMEPCRAWVDFYVVELVNRGIYEINSDSKARLLSLISANVKYDNQIMPLMIACHYLVSRLKRIYQGETLRLLYPSLLDQ